MLSEKFLPTCQIVNEKKSSDQPATLQPFQVLTIYVKFLCETLANSAFEILLLSRCFGSLDTG